MIVFGKISTGAEYVLPQDHPLVELVTVVCMSGVKGLGHVEIKLVAEEDNPEEDDGEREPTLWDMDFKGHPQLGTPINKIGFGDRILVNNQFVDVPDGDAGTLEEGNDHGC